MQSFTFLGSYFSSNTYQMITRGIARGNEQTENYHPDLQLPLALWSVSEFQLSV